jgi:c-di-GMP-binding flagellar brake protein YcgR
LDKRDNKRKRIRLTVIAEPGAIRAYTADVSAGGMFLVCSKVFAPGTRVRVMVRTTDGLALGVGVVRWSKRVPPVMLQHVKGGMGIEFTWISPELQEILNQHCAISPT